MKTEFWARLIAPFFPDAPPEIKENWMQGCKKSTLKTYQALKKAIKTRKDFDQKIAEPTIRAIAGFTPRTYRTIHGLTYRDIMSRTKEKLKRTAKKYFAKRKDVFETGGYEKKVEFGVKKYAEKWCKFRGPLQGYYKGGIKGLQSLGTMALAGDRNLNRFLKRGQDKIDGDPYAVICPAKSKQFKRVVLNKIIHCGSEIINSDYNGNLIKRQNVEINQLVNEYRRPEVVKFLPTGASHIDFVMIERINPNNTDKMIKQLGLDIQVSLI
jgi:hypothetical protein